MRAFDEIVKRGMLWDIQDMQIMKAAYIKLPDCKTCSVVWSDNELGWEHVSVAPRHRFSIPSWEDMCVLKDVFFDEEEEVYQIHPKKSHYVNLKENCLHLWKPKGIDLTKLVNEKAGVKND